MLSLQYLCNCVSESYGDHRNLHVRPHAVTTLRLSDLVGAPSTAASASCCSSPPRPWARSSPTSTGWRCRTGASVKWSGPTVVTVSASADRSPGSRSPTPDSRPYRIAVLASGRGSNLQALMDAIAEGTLAAEIVGVFSDRSKAVALHRARAAGVPARSLSPKGFASRAEFAAALFASVDELRPDLQ